MSNDHTIHTFSPPSKQPFWAFISMECFPDFHKNIKGHTTSCQPEYMSCTERGSVSELLCESHWSGVNSGRARLEQTLADWLWSAGDLSCALKAGGGVSLPTDRRSKAGWNWYDGFPLSRRVAFSLLFVYVLYIRNAPRLSLIADGPFFNLQALVCIYFL